MSLPEDFESSLYLAPCTSNKRGVTMNLVLHGFVRKKDTVTMNLVLHGFVRKKDT